MKIYYLPVVIFLVLVSIIMGIRNVFCNLAAFNYDFRLLLQDSTVFADIKTA